MEEIMERLKLLYGQDLDRAVNDEIQEALREKKEIERQDLKRTAKKEDTRATLRRLREMGREMEERDSDSSGTRNGGSQFLEPRPWSTSADFDSERATCPVCSTFQLGNTNGMVILLARISGTGELALTSHTMSFQRSQTRR
jgi:hypothetical protein